MYSSFRSKLSSEGQLSDPASAESLPTLSGLSVVSASFGSSPFVICSKASVSSSRVKNCLQSYVGSRPEVSGSSPSSCSLSSVFCIVSERISSSCSLIGTGLDNVACGCWLFIDPVFIFKFLPLIKGTVSLSIVSRPSPVKYFYLTADCLLERGLSLVAELSPPLLLLFSTTISSPFLGILSVNLFCSAE